MGEISSGRGFHLGENSLLYISLQKKALWKGGRNPNGNPPQLLSLWIGIWTTEFFRRQTVGKRKSLLLLLGLPPPGKTRERRRNTQEPGRAMALYLAKEANPLSKPPALPGGGTPKTLPQLGKISWGGAPIRHTRALADPPLQTPSQGKKTLSGAHAAMGSPHGYLATQKRPPRASLSPPNNIESRTVGHQTTPSPSGDSPHNCGAPLHCGK